MSHMSMGSLSPQHPVSPSLWLGSSHVCGKRKHMFDGAETWSGFLLFECRLSGTRLWNSSIIPDVAFVRKHIRDITKIPLLYVLFQWVEGIFGGNLINRWPKPSYINLIKTVRGTNTQCGHCIIKITINWNQNILAKRL